jgi:putative DNA primase/helicase
VHTHTDEDRATFNAGAHKSPDKFRDALNDVARHFYGTPNRKLSKGGEMRYNERGSLSIDLKKGTWYDFETGEGGGTLDLVIRELKLKPDDYAAAAQWCEDNGFIKGDAPRAKSNGGEPPKKRVHGDRFPGLGKPATTYPYPNAGGTLIFEVARFEPKDFRPRQPDGNGSWYWDLDGLAERLVVYRLPEVTEAVAAGRRVFICEGEKDADAAVAIGLDATCNQGGTGGGWRDQYNETFRDADVIVVPHNDDAGRKHADRIAGALTGIAEKIRVLKLWESWKECPPKGDLHDWREAGHSREQLDALVDAAPDHEASAGDDPSDDVITPQTEKNTDLGNARRLVRLHGDDLRYVHAWRSWLVWRDGHWRRDSDQAVVRRAKATVEEMFEEARKINSETRRASLRGWALKSQEGKRLREMIGLAQSEIAAVLPVEKIDADPYLLGVQNGVVDLRTGAFRDARREDYVTRHIGAAYDPRARCPNWEAFLKKVLPDEVIAYLQRAVGYVLTGLTVEEVLFVLWGTGANGKSTFRETLFALLGDYAVGADASLLITPKQGGGATPDLARLHSRRLVTVNETEQNDRLNEARVKFITSHDVITARNLYEAPFDFTPTHKTFLTTNHKPIVRGADEGTWRRIHLLPFVRKIPVEERDVHFREEKLLPELSGVLNWALAGLRAYRCEGLNPPEAVRAATKEYREDMDLIGQWIEERCERDLHAETPTAHLYSDYKDWAEDEIGFVFSKITFGRELADRGFKKADTGRSRGFRGLKLRW